MRGERLAGPLAVSVLPSLAHRWLLPRLPALAAAHPEIDLTVHAEARAVDLAREAIDLGIRYGKGHYYYGVRSATPYQATCGEAAGGVDDGGLGGAVRGLRRAAGRRAGSRGPARSAALLHHRPAAAGRAQERRADGGEDRPVPRR